MVQIGTKELRKYNVPLISFLTSSSQFSFILSAQLVCCRNKCSSPHFTSLICGSEDRTWSVTRWEPRPRDGRVRACWVYVVDMVVVGDWVDGERGRLELERGCWSLIAQSRGNLHAKVDEEITKNNYGSVSNSSANVGLI